MPDLRIDLSVSEDPHLGEICARTFAMPSDANANGDIFGGWLLAQMDLAAAVVAARTAKGRITTVALDAMKFLAPVNVGDLVTAFGKIERIGTTSMAIKITVVAERSGLEGAIKVTEGVFTYVAIDETGRPRPVSVI